MNDKCHILFTSSGRRVSLLKKFKETFDQEKLNGKIITADLKETAPTAFISDKHYLVPKVNDENYLNKIIEICKRESIDILIPLIDTELTLLASHISYFEKLGVKVLISGTELVEIANNKIKTFKFFKDNGISTPKVYSEDEIKNGKLSFPLLVKPWDGSSSKNVFKVHNMKELLFFKKYINNPMIQEYISGQEFTIDLFVDFFGNIKTVVPRQRVEIRAGEVSKGKTVKDTDIIEAAIKVAKCLPKPVGCITLQCFKQDNGDIKFIEINPRFGGGVPLSIEAGANFPLWAIQICKGLRFVEQDFSWRENLTMLRYDDALFLESIVT